MNLLGGPDVEEVTISKVWEVTTSSTNLWEGIIQAAVRCSPGVTTGSTPIYVLEGKVITMKGLEVSSSITQCSTGLKSCSVSVEWKGISFL